MARTPAYRGLYFCGWHTRISFSGWPSFFRRLATKRFIAGEMQPEQNVSCNFDNLRSADPLGRYSKNALLIKMNLFLWAMVNTQCIIQISCRLCTLKDLGDALHTVLLKTFAKSEMDKTGIEKFPMVLHIQSVHLLHRLASTCWLYHPAKCILHQVHFQQHNFTCSQSRCSSGHWPCSMLY